LNNTPAAAKTWHLKGHVLKVNDWRLLTTLRQFLMDPVFTEVSPGRYNAVVSVIVWINI
jgi:hypothetical protein